MADQNITSFGWNDTVQAADDSGDFALLKPGYAYFRVAKLEKGYFDGSANMPPCNQAILTLSVTDAEGTTTSVFERLSLLSNWLWKITGFFKACRLIPEETPVGASVSLPWDSVVGAEGYCRVDRRKYTKDGKERETNSIPRFVHGEKVAEAAAACGAAPAPQQQATAAAGWVPAGPYAPQPAAAQQQPTSYSQPWVRQ